MALVPTATPLPKRSRVGFCSPDARDDAELVPAVCPDSFASHGDYTPHTKGHFTPVGSQRTVPIIALEAIIGAGKSTLLDAVKEHFGETVVIVQEVSQSIDQINRILPTYSLSDFPPFPVS